MIIINLWKDIDNMKIVRILETYLFVFIRIVNEKFVQMYYSVPRVRYA